MPAVEIDLTIVLRTPLSIGAGSSAGSLADKSIVRDGWGRPVIPGSQLKGKLRHAAEALARALNQYVADLPRAGQAEQPDSRCVIQAIFGGPETRRAPLRFADLVLADTSQSLDELAIDSSMGLRRPQLRPSVSINRRRGTAEDARLLLQETTADNLIFTHERAISGELDEERQLALLLAALRLTPRWGGAKSRGLGWASVAAQATFDGQQFHAHDEEWFAQALRQWESR